MFIKGFIYKQFVVGRKAPEAEKNNTKYCDNSHIQAGPKLICGELIFLVFKFLLLRSAMKQSSSNNIRFSICRRYLSHFKQFQSHFISLSIPPENSKKYIGLTLKKASKGCQFDPPPSSFFPKM